MSPVDRLEAARPGVQRALSEAMLGTRLLAALGVLVLGARFALVGGADYLEHRARREAQEEARVDRKRDDRPGRPDALDVARDLAAPSATPSGSAAPSAAAAPAGSAASTFETRTLLVDVGPPRSDVLVNGRRVGKTPFAGQWSCANGDPVRVLVVPEHAAPIERLIVCGGETMSASRR